MFNRTFFRAVVVGAVVAFIGVLIYAGVTRLGRDGSNGYNPADFNPASLMSGTPPPASAPYVSSEYDIVRAMLNLAGTTQDDFVADLGSGDGRIPIIAAREKGARGLGVDIDPALVRESIANARNAGVADRVTFRQEDLFTTPLQDVTVLTLFLLPELNIQLRPRILAQMRPGSRVVSNQFNMGDWPPDRTDTNRANPIYMWIVPAQVAGTWRFSVDGAEPATLTLEQRYQQVSGTVTTGQAARPIGDVTLQGTRIAFTADGSGGRRRFEGQVADGRMQGPGWSAVRTGN